MGTNSSRIVGKLPKLKGMMNKLLKIDELYICGKMTYIVLDAFYSVIQIREILSHV